MFGHIIEFLFGAVLLVIVYQVFISDYIADKREENRGSREKYDSTAKIAQVKLVSADVKDIETFITNNAKYLSSEMVTRLVDRIEAIRTDQIIDADSLLKKKFDELEPEEEPAVVKRASRKR